MEFEFCSFPFFLHTELKGFLPRDIIIENVSMDIIILYRGVFFVVKNLQEDYILGYQGVLQFIKLHFIRNIF